MSGFKIMNKVGRKGVLDVSATVEAIGDGTLISFPPSPS